MEFSASVGFIHKESVTMHSHTIVEFSLHNFGNAPKSFKLKLHRTLCVTVGLISLPATDKPHYVMFCNNNNLHDHLKRWLDSHVSSMIVLLRSLPKHCRLIISVANKTPTSSSITSVPLITSHHHRR